MKFSVIIPVYNKAFCISTTLNSVLQQTYAHFEVICVDDGSSDNSVEIINGFSDDRISVIQQQNSGVSVARNTGIDAAKGEWICFLDADDWWHPNFLMSLAATIQHSPSASIIASAFYAIPDKHDWQPEPWLTRETNQVEIIKDLPSRWMKGNIFFTSSICVKKEILLSLNTWFVPKQHSGEDLDLWFRLAEFNHIYLIKEPLVAYRTEQAQSLSSIHKKLTADFHIVQLQQRLIDNQVPVSLINSSQQFIIQDAITRSRLALIQGYRKKAVALLWSTKAGWMTKRFIFTLIMLFMPSRWVSKWQERHSGRRKLK